MTAIDLFCGAGGSTEGMVDAGVEVVTAVNHWDLAIETHNTNHPTTDHDCVDVRSVHPSRYPRTDIFWASPECTNHSLAKGRRRVGINQLDLFGEQSVDPAEERSRATMREVIEFAEYHRNPIVIVENVVDVRKWAYYDAWPRDMVNLGYEYRTLYLNAQFFGVPQSRDRWYTVFWQKGNPSPDLDFRPRAHCKKCGRYIRAVQAWKRPDFPWGRYGQRRQYVYRCPVCASEVEPPMEPASQVIDWSIHAERIGDREKPLAPATMERIREGLRRFGYRAVVVDVMHSHAEASGKVSSADSPLPTQTTRQSQAVAVPPFITPLRGTAVSTSVDEPMTTIVAAAQQHALVALPFILGYANSKSPPRSVDEPMHTIVTSNIVGLVTPPFLIQMRRTGQAYSTEEPLAAITAGGNNHALVMAYYGGNAVYSRANEPLPGITTVQRHALIEPDEVIEDCTFRMLQPDELKRGMSFPDRYIILGSKRNQVRQIGNAVACNVARWIVKRCVESLSA